MAAAIKSPSRARIRTPLFLAGVAVALIAFVGTLAVGMLFSSGARGGDVAVVVAGQDIQARTPIDSGMLTTRQLPSNAVPPGAFTRVGDVSGYSALVKIVSGQVVSANLVTSNPDQLTTSASAYLPIPKGFVALTLPTNEQQGVAGYVAEGDYINVMATLNTGLFSASNQRVVTRTVFTSLHVIRIGPPTTAPKQGQVQGLAGSVTVVMSQCDAQYMDWLIVNASLKYSLLSYHDYGTTPSPTPDLTCPSTVAPASPIGPAQVDARWGFTRS